MQIFSWMKKYPLRISTAFFCTVIYAGVLTFGISVIGLPWSIIATGILGLIFTGLTAMVS